jgi:hypothetical protein
MKDLVTRNKHLEDQVFELLEVLEPCQRTINSLAAYCWNAGYMRAASLRLLAEILGRPEAQAQLHWRSQGRPRSCRCHRRCHSR